MGQLQDAFRDAAGEVAQIKAQPSNRYWWLYGTIMKKNSNGTLDVKIDGVTIQHVKATVSCMMANVGDRVIVLKAGPLMTCVDVIATSDKLWIPATSLNGEVPEGNLPIGTSTSKGILQVGSGLSVSNGVVSFDNADYVKSSGQSIKLFIGSVVRTVGSGADSVRVWDRSKFSSRFGRPFRAGEDYVGFANGDAVANDVHIQGASYLSTNESVYAVLSKSQGGSMSLRINFLVALNS